MKVIKNRLNDKFNGIERSAALKKWIDQGCRLQLVSSTYCISIFTIDNLSIATIETCLLLKIYRIDPLPRSHSCFHENSLRGLHLFVAEVSRIFSHIFDSRWRPDFGTRPLIRSLLSGTKPERSLCRCLLESAGRQAALSEDCFVGKLASNGARIRKHEVADERRISPEGTGLESFYGIIRLWHRVSSRQLPLTQFSISSCRCTNVNVTGQCVRSSAREVGFPKVQIDSTT
ncbi:unnamed protein product [Nesidiocoris tenuis]|uniref:Uncharacterized protein n=1 Tax=Nesidiocoris tenuis TaxID=355587 RepID=A0A6H5GVQ8_9HEMI|nr:unnamed protein product [Nesidiocoris tenuis]